MAIDLSNVTAITIPEGEVIEISINGTTVWSSGPSPYIWTTIDNTTRTIGSAATYSNITEFATIPSNAVGLRLTLNYPNYNPNTYTFYNTNINTASISTVTNSLANKPTTINTASGGYQYLFAIRYRRSNYNTEQYACYWYLRITNGDKLNLTRSYSSGTAPSSSRGMYPIIITKIEAAIPNPDYQA